LRGRPGFKKYLNETAPLYTDSQINNVFLSNLVFSFLKLLFLTIRRRKLQKKEQRRKKNKEER
jgi:hypothetical protein